MTDQLNERGRNKSTHKKVYRIKHSSLSSIKGTKNDNINESEYEMNSENEEGKNKLALEQKGINCTTSYDTRLKRFGDGGLLIPSQLVLESCLNEKHEPKVIDPIVQLSRDNNNNNLNQIKNTEIDNLQRRTTLLRPSLSFDKNDYVKLLKEPIDLLPIRIDLDLQGYYLSDYFMYNLNEPVVTPKYLAETLCEDLYLNESNLQLVDRNLVEEISSIIERQIDSYRTLREIEIENETLFKDHEENKAILVPIQLDLILGKFHLKDAFLWDVNAVVTPLQFASTLASDLGLGGEFVSTINHAIHEQLLQFRTARTESVPYLKSMKSRGELKQVMQLLRSAPEVNPYLESILFTKRADELIHTHAATFNLSLKYMTSAKRQALAEKLSKSSEFVPRSNWTRPGNQRRVSKRTVTLRYSNLNQQAQSPLYE